MSPGAGAGLGMPTRSGSVGGGGGGVDTALSSENTRLASELRDAKARIRNLEVQVETMKGNAQRAAKALMQE